LAGIVLAEIAASHTASVIASFSALSIASSLDKCLISYETCYAVWPQLGTEHIP